MYGLAPPCALMHFLKATGRNFWTEAVTHLVLNEQYDVGPVIKKLRVDIPEELVAGFPDNNGCKTLQQMVLPVEHQVQIAAVRAFCRNMVYEVIHEGPVVLPGEEQILAWAKAQAIQHHPSH